MLKPKVRGSRQLDDASKILSSSSGLEGRTASLRHTTKRPQLGEAAAPLPCPFRDLRLKIGVSDSPFPVPSPGTRVRPLGPREQAKDGLEGFFSFQHPCQKRIKADPSPLDGASEFPRESLKEDDKNAYVFQNKALGFAGNKGTRLVLGKKGEFFYMQQQ